jgi:hypothetical protein
MYHSQLSERFRLPPRTAAGGGGRRWAVGVLTVLAPKHGVSGIQKFTSFGW